MLYQHMRAAALLFVSLIALSAQAQLPITTIPASPVAGAPFVVRFTIAACVQSISTAVNGTNIDITVHFASGCIATPAPLTFDVNVGPLPVGTYTIRLLSSFDNSVLGTAPAVVTADIPALDPRVLAILAITLSAIAILRTK